MWTVRDTTYNETCGKSVIPYNKTCGQYVTPHTMKRVDST